MNPCTASREIAAPIDQVFAAFTDPERHARWWGPDGFTNTFHLREFKTGGKWSYVMHGPDGRDYKNESVFEEVSPRKIVIQHISGPKYRLTSGDGRFLVAGIRESGICRSHGTHPCSCQPTELRAALGRSFG
jgi:hypothetical protein